MRSPPTGISASSPRSSTASRPGSTPCPPELTAPLARRRDRAPTAQVVLVGEERRGDQEVGRRAVARDRDVVEHGQAQQCFDIDIVRLRGQRVPKEDDQIELMLDQHRADLSVSAERSREEQLDREPGRMRDLRPGRPGRDQFAAPERPAVKGGPVRQVIFTGVVRDQGDPRRPDTLERNGVHGAIVASCAGDTSAVLSLWRRETFFLRYGARNRGSIGLTPWLVAAANPRYSWMPKASSIVRSSE